MKLKDRQFWVFFTNHDATKHTENHSVYILLGFKFFYSD